jgi:N-dimethylarginine dimethylaminohydrolase
VAASGGRLFVGHGFRSTVGAVDALRAAALPSVRAVVPLRLVDPLFYHLDTCFCPLPDGVHAVAYEPAFDAGSLATLRRSFHLLPVTEEEARAFACNAVCLRERGGETHYVCHPTSDRLRHSLAAVGVGVVEVDVSEFHKAGGSVRCMLLRVDE